VNVLFNPDKEDLVMETPFTIARGVLTEKNGQPTIDYAYMGCSEFEKGAIHRSARRLLNSKWVLRERGIRVFKRNVPLMAIAQLKSIEKKYQNIQYIYLCSTKNSKKKNLE
jgi:hypothetical protein